MQYLGQQNILVSLEDGQYLVLFCLLFLTVHFCFHPNKKIYHPIDLLFCFFVQQNDGKSYYILHSICLDHLLFSASNHKCIEAYHQLKDVEPKTKPFS